MLSFLYVFKDMRTMKQILPPPDANRIVTKLKAGDFDIYKNIIEVSPIVRSDPILAPLSKAVGMAQ